MKKYGIRTYARVLAFLCALVVSGTVSLNVYAYPGTISTDNVNVRASASTGARMPVALPAARAASCTCTMACCTSACAGLPR